MPKQVCKNMNINISFKDKSLKKSTKLQLKGLKPKKFVQVSSFLKMFLKKNAKG